ncbi:hypothetical protein HMPREF1980_02429 [Actinomyces sp. oral taxon 172 str. F0311]|nr:hypothetical protein HMPREF1980_02429 [Actinomyces sp. oral taxon 172 str. F0311]
MSPCPPDRWISALGFPRVSGDEPTLAVNEQATEGFSPRERG